MKKDNKGIILIVATFLLTLVLILNYDFLVNYDWKSLGYLGIFMVMLISSATIIFPLPGLVVTSFAGAFFSPILIGIVGGLGSTIGELTGYYFGYGGGEILNSKKYNNIKKQIKTSKATALAIFLFSLVPNPIFDFVGIASGVLKYPVWKFFLACLLGKIIKITFFAFMGESLFNFILGI